MKSLSVVVLVVLQVAQLAQVCSCRPRPDPNCQRFERMKNTVGRLHTLSKDLQLLMRTELGTEERAEDRLEHLPAMTQTMDHLNATTLNGSLSELYRDVSLYKLHMDWLHGARHDVGLAATTGQADVHRRIRARLTELAAMTRRALLLLQQEVPPLPVPSFPVLPGTFDVLLITAELAGRLKHYCDWSKRVLKLLAALSRCT